MTMLTAVLVATAVGLTVHLAIGSPGRQRHATHSQRITAGLRPRWRRAGSPRRAARRRAQSVPDVIELFVLVIRAGLTTRKALQFLTTHAPSAARPAFVAAVERLDRGDAPADALAALPSALGRGIEPVVDLIGPADRYGLPLAPALEQLASEARNSRRRLAEAAARQLPVRLSFPLVICTLPSFVLLAVAPAVLAALSSLGGPAP